MGIENGVIQWMKNAWQCQKIKLKIFLSTSFRRLSMERGELGDKSVMSFISFNLILRNARVHFIIFINW